MFRNIEDFLSGWWNGLEEVNKGKRGSYGIPSAIKIKKYKLIYPYFPPFIVLPVMANFSICAKDFHMLSPKQCTQMLETSASKEKLGSQSPKLRLCP